ncbi:MAG: putative glycoside hydrolase [Massiliimalia sp.]|jgi:hypothetical protein
MAKYRKIKRNQRIYRKHPRIPSWVKFALILVLAVGIGFVGGKAVMDGLQKAKEDKKPQSSVASEDVSQTSKPESADSEESLSSTEQEDPQSEQTMEAAVMPVEVMKDSTQRQQFIQSVKTQGKNTIILDLKDEAGYLQYQSRNEIAKECNAVASDAVNLTQVCREITQAGLTPVGRISTLMDKVSSRVAAKTTYLYRGQEGTAWLDNSADNGGKTWLNPYRENTVSFLTDLTDEITAAGCQTLILTHLEYPDRNNSDMGISGEAVSKSDTLKNLYQKMEQAAEENQAKLMLQFDLNSYYGAQTDSVYGGDPALIGAESVLLSVDSQTLAASAGLDVLSGETDPVKAVEKISAQMGRDGAELYLLIPEAEQAAFAGLEDAVAGVAVTQS